MAHSFAETLGFCLDLASDVAGTLRDRWHRYNRRVVEGEDIATIGVDVLPLLEPMTTVGWYEWNLLATLDQREDGLSFNLYAHTFIHPSTPPPPAMPGTRRMRLRVHQLPSRLLFPLAPTLAFLNAVVEPLLRVLDGNDVLFTPSLLAQPSQLPCGETTVATVHDLAFAVMPRIVAPETVAELKRRLPEALFRTRRLIAVSDVTAEDLADYLQISPSRIHTVHEGLDATFTANDDGVDPPDDEAPQLPERYLLFVSPLEPRNNVGGVLRAFRLLVDWGYPGNLLLVGRWGWRSETLRSELASSPVSDRVSQLECVERRHLPRLYRNADALLFPSWLEGFGLPLLEAMASGTPVVTSGQSAMPEVAGPAAVYVDPASPHGIASAAAALLEDPQHRQRLVSLGQQRARRFSWDRAAAATAQILRQAADLPPAGDDEYRVDPR